MVIGDAGERGATVQPSRSRPHSCLTLMACSSAAVRCCPRRGGRSPGSTARTVRVPPVTVALTTCSCDGDRRGERRAGPGDRVQRILLMEATGSPCIVIVQTVYWRTDSDCDSQLASP